MDKKQYPIFPNFREKAHINKEDYQRLYQQSIEEPDIFWAQQAEKWIDWNKKWDKVRDCDFETAKIQWFSGAKLNVCYNCVDRHLEKRANQTALIWEGDNPEESKKWTYQQLFEEVCKFANVLKKNGIKKNDSVCIYMSMTLEATVAMLACARIGAVHCVIFGGIFS